MKLILFLATLGIAQAQLFPPAGGAAGVPNVSSLPGTCTVGGTNTLVFLTTGATGLYQCGPTSGVQWTNVQTGMISLVDPGIFPATPTAVYLYADASGTNLPDSSGNGNNATLVASPTISSLGVTFNGTTQYATLPSAITQAQSMLLCTDWNFNKIGGNFYPLIGSSAANDFSLFANHNLNNPTVYWGAHGGFDTESIVGLGPVPSCLGYLSDSGNDRLFIDGTEAVYSKQTATGGIARTGALQLFGATGNGFFAPGTGYCAAFWVAEITADQMKNATARCHAIMAARGVPTAYTTSGASGYQLLLFGDSITADAGQYPTKLHTTNSYTQISAAVGGLTAKALSAQCPSISQAVYSPTASRNVLVWFAGTNDLTLATDTPVGAVNSMISCAKFSRSLGYYFIAIEMLDRTGIGAKVQNYNRLLRAAASNVDRVLSLHDYTLSRGIFDPTAPGANSNASCFDGGGIHPATSGTGNCAQTIADAVSEAIESTDVNGSYVTSLGTTFLSSAGTGTGPTNTVTETSLISAPITGSKTIPAYIFGYGTPLQVQASGFFSLPTAADALTMRLKCGSTVIGSASLTFAAGALTNGVWRFLANVSATDSSATGKFITNTIFEATGGSLTPTESKVLNTSTVAFDFTTACALDLTAQWGAAQATESIQGTNTVVWVP